jgi:endonuclease III
VQYTCDRVVEFPAKIDQLSKRLEGRIPLLSVNDLQQQLIAVQLKLQNSSDVAIEHLNQLAKSLQRNIELAVQGQDTRMAQVINLATLIQDAAGVLQELQNKLHSFDLSNAAQTIMELRHLCEQIGNFQENVDLLISKSPN